MRTWELSNLFVMMTKVAEKKRSEGPREVEHSRNKEDAGRQGTPRTDMKPHSRTRARSHCVENLLVPQHGSSRESNSIFFAQESTGLSDGAIAWDVRTDAFFILIWLLIQTSPIHAARVLLLKRVTCSLSLSPRPLADVFSSVGNAPAFLCASMGFHAFPIPQPFFSRQCPWSWKLLWARSSACWTYAQKNFETSFLHARCGAWRRAGHASPAGPSARPAKFLIFQPFEKVSCDLETIMLWQRKRLQMNDSCNLHVKAYRLRFVPVWVLEMHVHVIFLWWIGLFACSLTVPCQMRR